MKKYTYLATLPLLLLLTACPYEGSNPAGDAEKADKYDKILLGEWVCKNEDGTLEEVKFSADGKKWLHTYHNGVDKQKVKSQVVYYKSWPNLIAGTLIFTARTNDNKCYYFKAEIAGNDKIYISVVSDALFKEQFPSPEHVGTDEIRACIEQHIANPALFGEKLMFVRVGSTLHKLQQSKKGF